MTPKKILIIDDEPVVVTLLKARVGSRGFLVETANGGVSGLEKAKTWQPDFILLDIVMPEMDGYETCRRLKAMKETASIPVVLFTAAQETQLQVLAQKAGAARVVQKPFVEQVFKAISEILGPE
ncbi:MAG: response regulator [Candidatus Omnitrophica bacterium]|nr:response regulator [Candidatus Omnitrophota bacterium]